MTRKRRPARRRILTTQAIGIVSNGLGETAATRPVTELRNRRRVVAQWVEDLFERWVREYPMLFGDGWRDLEKHARKHYRDDRRALAITRAVLLIKKQFNREQSDAATRGELQFGSAEEPLTFVVENCLELTEVDEAVKRIDYAALRLDRAPQTTTSAAVIGALEAAARQRRTALVRVCGRHGPPDDALLTCVEAAAHRLDARQNNLSSSQNDTPWSGVVSHDECVVGAAPPTGTNPAARDRGSA